MEAEEIKQKLADRGETFDVSVIDEIVKLDERRREILTEVEVMKSERNKKS